MKNKEVVIFNREGIMTDAQAEWVHERACIIWAEDQTIPFAKCEKRAQEMWDKWSKR